MSNPVEFGKFYKLLKAVKAGDKEKNKELEWMLAEYEHAKDSSGPYDELGQIFCHHGVMELYEYTAFDDLKLISSLDISVWDYLEKRMKVSLPKYMVSSMVSHAREHNLVTKISNKWNASSKEIEENIEDLAKYVVEGIIEIIED